MKCYGYRKEDPRSKGNAWIYSKDLADKLGVTSSAIANYENNVSHPKEPILYSLLDVLGVDANFLFQDEMHNVYTEAVSLDEMETIVKKYRKLDDDGKELIKSTLDYLEKKQKSVIKFPRHAPGTKELNSLDDNTIDFLNMTPVKISEQPSALDREYTWVLNHLQNTWCRITS